MIPDDLLEFLRCPQTLQPLTLADAELVAEANVRLSNRQLEDKSDLLDAALIRADRKVLYPVCGGIAILLAERAIVL